MSSLIKIAPYNPAWPGLFAAKAEKIQKALGDNFIAIHHVGSTSVPGLAAKPKIDIIAVVRDLNLPDNTLTDLGFIYKGGFNLPLRKTYTLRRPSISVNLHIFEEDDPEIELNLLFREYLKGNPDALEKYAKLKEKLVKEESSHFKNNSIYNGYTLGKNHFIQEVVKLTGFDKIRFVICTHYTELETAKNFRQKYFFDHAGIKDPYHWTFNHLEHEHLMLYLGTQIIGYAHIQLWKDMRAAMRIIVIDEPYRSQNYGAHFLRLIEKYLKMKGIKSLHAESSPAALEFYRKEGYVDMQFNDPDGYESDERDTPVGKILRSGNR